MSTASARETLEARAAELDSRWITSELVGGSRRRRAEHDAREERRRAAEVALAAELRGLAALPDADLGWLLDHGWEPNRAGTPVGGGHPCGRLQTPHPTWAPDGRAALPGEPPRCPLPAAYRVEMLPPTGWDADQGPRVSLCADHTAEIRAVIPAETIHRVVQTTRPAPVDTDDVPRPTRRRPRR